MSVSSREAARPPLSQSPTQAVAPSDRAPQSQLKSDLRGMSFDAGAQYLAPRQEASKAGGAGLARLSAAPGTQGKGSDKGKGGTQTLPDGTTGPKGATLLTFDQVNAVWQQKVMAWARSHRVKETDKSAWSGALPATKKQVGDLNFQNWREQGGGNFWALGTVATVESYETDPEKAERERKEAEARKLPYEMTPQGMREGARRRVEGYNKKALALGAGVAEAERACQKLASPEGVAGIAYQITTGAYGLAYGVAATGTAKAKDAVSPETQGVVTATTGGPSNVAGDAKDVAESATTSVEIMTGKLNQYYRATRPAKGKYDAAYTSFCSARDAFNKARTDSEKGAAEDAISAAVTTMVAAARIFLDTCRSLGIPEKAASVDKLAAAIVAGTADAIELGVGAMAGAVGPGGKVGKVVESVTGVGSEGAKQGAKKMGENK
ncbi:MAG: hypothetical protein IT385_27190 [Deltaproteobacteria bacterium]|nr:hypothetical protein [Deltaproteobacteria bacterium]